MRPVDIAPFALPNHPDDELRFEEPRDIERVVVAFEGSPPRRVGLSYLRRNWPHNRIEQSLHIQRHRPAELGWERADDLFNSAWQKAAARVERLKQTGRLAITFQPIRREFPEFPGCRDYDVTFRRTLGIRVDVPSGARIRGIQVFTTSPPVRSRLRVELDAGRKAPGKSLRLSGYNAVIGRLEGGPGVRPAGGALRLRHATRRAFHVDVRHMRPAHGYCYDEGFVTFELDGDAFTISMTALEEQGPIWHPGLGVYVARADDATSYAAYRKRIRGATTVAQQVMAHREQSFGNARHCQPRPHPDAFILGWKRARQHFWVEPNGDIVLHRLPFLCWATERTARFLNKGNGRFFFGLQRWCDAGRFNDPPPVLAYNIRLKRDQIALEQKSLAVPLEPPPEDGELAGDETLVAMVRFRLTNVGARPALAELPVGYSSDSRRALGPRGDHVGQDDDMVPVSPRDELAAHDGRLTSQWERITAVRAAWVGTMRPKEQGPGVVFQEELRPGETAELLLKIPYIHLTSESELSALDALEFDACYEQVRAFWHREGRRGASVRTPEPNINAAYALHEPIVMISDPALPDGSGLVNTSVGTATYGNYSNEACMIQEELDLRGLPDEARRRLEVYIRYQGKGKLRGNFTDFDGLYFGTGGFEGSASYVQSHGWVMWRLAQHYFLTGDADWLRRIAGSLVAAADWVFRQRRNTMGQLPHSRGWEHGFLPAGGLEDVEEYCHWLVNNAMSWRGTEWAARALADINHPEANRIRRESNAYRRDLIRGFETSRRHSPLVRLRNGRWVPHYPSRLYRRGREFGWIRELLEGSVYLLLSGLYKPGSKQAGWILDDYLDNRYMCPPYGYVIEDVELDWFSRGGFSIQPNLLAGLLPHLERDEPEIYIWMFFNAFAACYREEINATIEHPMPTLGFSNQVPFKTSDQANAMKWLAYMYVYALGRTLHLGRALPRQWLRDGEDIGVRGIVTPFGTVSVAYRSAVANGRIAATAELKLRLAPQRTLVRFRHPQGKPIKAARINGKRHRRFDAVRGDVDVTGLEGTLEVVAEY